MGKPSFLSISSQGTLIICIRQGCRTLLGYKLKIGAPRNSPRRNPNLVHLPIWDEWKCFRTSSSKYANPSESIDQRKHAVSSQNRRLSLHPSPYTQFLPTCLYPHPHSMNPSNPPGSSVYIMVHSRPPSAVSSTLFPHPSRVSTSIGVSSMPQYLLVSDNPDCAPFTHQSLTLRDLGNGFPILSLIVRR